MPTGSNWSAIRCRPRVRRRARGGHERTNVPQNLLDIERLLHKRDETQFVRAYLLRPGAPAEQNRGDQARECSDLVALTGLEGLIANSPAINYCYTRVLACS